MNNESQPKRGEHEQLSKFIDAMPRCKCVLGIGLMGAELGIVKDCPIHGDGNGYRPPAYTYDGDNAD